MVLQELFFLTKKAIYAPPKPIRYSNLSLHSNVLHIHLSPFAIVVVCLVCGGCTAFTHLISCILADSGRRHSLIIRRACSQAAASVSDGSSAYYGGKTPMFILPDCFIFCQLFPHPEYYRRIFFCSLAIFEMSTVYLPSATMNCSEEAGVDMFAVSNMLEATCPSIIIFRVGS